MTGYWKNNIGGWNHKDSKRKKQTRNHFIRDKGRALLKTYSYKQRKVDETKYRNETVLIKTYKWSDGRKKVPTQKTADLYKVRVYFERPSLDIPAKTVALRAYKKGFDYWDRPHWYEAETGKSLREYLNLTWSLHDSVSVLEERKLGEIQLDWQAEKSKQDTVYVDEDGYGNDYLYGQLLQDWKKWTLYNDGKARKIGQKLANSSDRAAVREYLGKQDWEAEIRTHALSKSLAWFIH